MKLRRSLHLKYKQALSFACILIIAACTVEIPSDVIQPKEMEELLYDYHLAQALASDLPSIEKYKKELYERYVFQKHNITEAEFDSSLVWYMRNTKELNSIYDNLSKRFTKEKETLATYSRPEERSLQISPEGDTVNIWIDNRLYRLTNNRLTNKMLFKLSADSNYHVYDTFIWKLKADFLNQSVGEQAIMAMSLHFNNDSTMGVSQKITQTDYYSLSLQCDSNYQLREITGYVYYYQLPVVNNDTVQSISDDSRNQSSTLLLSDISLTRYHCKDSVLLNRDIQKTDSIVSDSIIKIDKEVKKPSERRKPAKEITN